MNRIKKNAVLALIVSNVIWGAASPIFKLSLQNIPPFTLAFIRFFFAGILFSYFAGYAWRNISWKTFFLICVGAFFAITVNISFFFLALPKTESINAPVIASSQPIFLYLFSILFLHEKPHKRVLWGILFSFIGVLIIILSPFFVDKGISFSQKELALEGNLFLIVATLGSTISTLIYKKVLELTNHIQVTFISFLFGAFSFLPFFLEEIQTWSFGELDWRGWFGIIFGVIFSSAIAYGLFNYGVSKIPAQEVGIFAYIDPIAAILLAIPLIGEYPTLSFFLGSILVFIGILIAEKRIHYHPLYKFKNQNSKAKNQNQK